MDKSLNEGVLRHRVRIGSTSPITIKRSSTPFDYQAVTNRMVVSRIIDNEQSTQKCHTHRERPVTKIISKCSPISSPRIGSHCISPQIMNQNDFHRMNGYNKDAFDIPNVTITKRITNVSVERGISTSPTTRSRNQATLYQIHPELTIRSRTPNIINYPKPPPKLSFVSSIEDHQRDSLSEYNRGSPYQCNSENVIPNVVLRTFRQKNDKWQALKDAPRPKLRRSSAIKDIQSDFVAPIPIDDDSQITNQFHSDNQPIITEAFRKIYTPNYDSDNSKQIPTDNFNDPIYSQFIYESNVINDHDDANSKISPSKEICKGSEHKPSEVVRIFEKNNLEVKNQNQKDIRIGDLNSVADYKEHKAGNFEINVNNTDCLIRLSGQPTIKIDKIIKELEITDIFKFNQDKAGLEKLGNDTKKDILKYEQLYERVKIRNAKLKEKLFNVKSELEHKYQIDKSKYEQKLSEYRIALKAVNSEHSASIANLTNVFESEKERLACVAIAEGRVSAELRLYLAKLNNDCDEKDQRIMKFQFEIDDLQRQLKDNIKLQEDYCNQISLEKKCIHILKEQLRLATSSLTNSDANSQLAFEIQEQQLIIKLYEKKTSEYQSEISRLISDLNKTRKQTQIEVDNEKQKFSAESEKTKTLNNYFSALNDLKNSQALEIKVLNQNIRDLETELAKLKSINLQRIECQTNFTDFPNNIFCNFSDINNRSNSDDNENTNTFGRRMNYGLRDTTTDSQKNYLSVSTIDKQIQTNSLLINTSGLVEHLDNPENISKFSKKVTPEYISDVMNATTFNSNSIRDMLVGKKEKDEDFDQENNCKKNPDICIEKNSGPSYNGDYYSNEICKTKDTHDLKIKDSNFVDSQLPLKYDQILNELMSLQKSQMDKVTEITDMKKNIEQVEMDLKNCQVSFEAYKHNLKKTLITISLRKSLLSRVFRLDEGQDPLISMIKISENCKTYPDEFLFDKEIQTSFEKIQKNSLQTSICHQSSQTDDKEPSYRITLQKNTQTEPIASSNENNTILTQESNIRQKKSISTKINQEDTGIQATTETIDQNVQFDGDIGHRALKHEFSSALTQTKESSFSPITEINTGSSIDRISSKIEDSRNIVSLTLPHVSIHQFSEEESPTGEKSSEHYPICDDQDDYKTRFTEQFNLSQQISNQNINLIMANSVLEDQIKQLNTKIRQYNRTLTKIKADLHVAMVSNAELSHAKSKLEEQLKARTSNVFYNRSDVDSLMVSDITYGERKGSVDEMEKLRVENQELALKYKELLEGMNKKEKPTTPWLKSASHSNYSSPNSPIKSFLRRENDKY
jgi:hypothetical protein